MPMPRTGRGKARGALVWLEWHFEETIAGACLVGLSSLMFLQVIMRYVFRSPLSWSDEIAVYCLIGLVYFGASFAVRERAHIRVLLGAWLLPHRAAVALAVLADLVWFAFNVLMLVEGIVLVVTYIGQPSYSAALEINLLWPTLLVPIGFGLMSLRMVQAYALWWRGGPAPFAPSADAVAPGESAQEL